MSAYPARVTQHAGITSLECAGSHISVILSAPGASIAPELIAAGIAELVDHARTCTSNQLAALEAERLRPIPRRH